MRIYVSHASSFDYKHELYEPLKSVLGSDHELILPHEASQEGMVGAKSVIPTCDLVLAEASYPSTGQGIELGWADMFGVPIKVIHRTGRKPSSAVALLTGDVSAYDDIRDAVSHVHIKRAE